MPAKEALLYEKLPGSAVRCHVCLWRCRIQPGKLGACLMRRNQDGVLSLLNYAEASSVAADPIEKKPLFHFYPGSLCFSLGTWGCNFHCQHCQNWQISFGTSEHVDRYSQHVPPELAVSLARRYGCQGISWTYNEPTIWLEYTLDCARLAKEQGLYTVYVTNGYITPEALDTIGPYLDAFRVDIKGFTDECYVRLAKVKRWREVLASAVRAQERWGMHVEVITNVIPTLNDSPEQLTALATWIRDNLGPDTPWHVTRFYPQHRMRHLPPTSVESLERAYEIGHWVGLRFVYVGNVPTHPGENTCCPACGHLVVRRLGYQTELAGLNPDGSGRCARCGTDVNIKTNAWQRSVPSQAAPRA
ncbi:MAG: AmmeMemoRadiSam system radical SAM enzyme [Chloroflexi bacterium]|nr:AmmeMemoRadiSam system radical SAM enzyme [Chloroflexota bacterium]